MTTQTILLVEDDEAFREVLSYSLRREGYEVREARDGQEALANARDNTPDLIVLDVMLPGLDGFSICRILRAEMETPIILLTARMGEMDKIVGLESGADDYVTKPFSTGELVARIRAVMRRARPSQSGLVIEQGPLRLNLERRRAYRQERELTLSPKEFDLLAELMRHPGIALSRDTLMDRVWGYDFMGDTRTVDVHIRWLREKIEEEPSNPNYIQTVRGVGYRFEV
jgi:phosphate regulon transcriptional regulator PhoB